MTLSSELIQEKNRLYSSSALVMLLQVEHAALSEPLRLARNIEDVEWGGFTWQRFAWDIGVLTKDDELPSLTIQVQNVDRMVQYECERAGGLVGAAVNVHLVSSDHLASGESLFSMRFDVTKTDADADWVTFTLGTENPYGLRYPAHVFTADLCRYRLTTGFKGEECQYAGAVESCGFTWEDCIARGNVLHFGGQPGLKGAIFDD